MMVIDKEMLKIAERVNGYYTRYADNIFFSAQKDKIQEIEKDVLDIFAMAELTPHKIKVKCLNNPEAIKLLGLNIINRKMHNVRGFKRSMRKSIHHIKRLLEIGTKDTPEFENAWRKLRGQMNFAKRDTLSPKLLEQYAELEKKIN